MPAGGLADAMRREGVSVMSGADMSKPLEDPTAYGLHRLVDGKVAGIAMPVWNWGDTTSLSCEAYCMAPGMRPVTTARFAP